MCMLFIEVCSSNGSQRNCGGHLTLWCLLVGNGHQTDMSWSHTQFPSTVSPNASMYKGESIWMGLVTVNKLHVPYFFEISPHLKILLPSKCCRMFLPTRLNKHCPRDLAPLHVKGQQQYMSAYAHYTCLKIGLLLKLSMRVRVDLYTCHPSRPQIVATPNRALISLQWDFEEIQYIYMYV